MAEKRMFAQSVIDSDMFLEMPATSQCLYFHLAMRADDDGFINKPKSIMRMVGAKDDDMNVLISKGFIKPFESGVVVVSHWKIHNNIRKDMYKPTVYQSEMKCLIVGKSGVYEYCNESGTVPLQVRNESVTETEQNRLIDKNRLDKNRLDKNNISPNKSADREIESDFEQLWSDYPSKQGKSTALKKYKSLIKSGKATKEQVADGISRYNDYIKKSGTEKRYIKYGSTFFNGECWNDDFETDKGVTWDESDPTVF